MSNVNVRRLLGVIIAFVTVASLAIFTTPIGAVSMLQPMVTSKYAYTGSTITVPDDFSSIQSAIDNSNAGDTIFVKSGTYAEHITINKAVYLQGQDKNTTIIDGTNSGNIVTFNADGITLTGFTIQNGLNNQYGLLLYSDNNVINDCIVKTCLVGANALGSNGNTFNNVEFSFNLYGAGGSQGCNNNKLINCNIHDNALGVIFGYCNGLKVINSDLYSNSGAGISGENIQSALIENNRIYSNSSGITFWSVAPSGNTVSGNLFESNENGIYFGNTARNNTITSNIFNNNTRGIYFTKNSGAPNYSNTFYHNDFIQNTTHAQVDEDRYSNTWDNGYPSGGNYWGGYPGLDLFSGSSQNIPGNDGIGDTPVTFNALNLDRYPMMARITPPTVASISPSAGPLGGGTVVTITGTNFYNPATVTIGGNPATDVTVDNSTSITCTTPVGMAGLVPVIVISGGTPSAAQNIFNYMEHPTVASISPSSGPIAGGTSLTISGTNFVGGATVTIGGNPTTGVTFVDSTSITCTAPASTVGDKDVVVTTAGGSWTLTCGFTYVATPTVASISPSAGPLGGGTTVTITGTNFYSPATVTIGGNPATGITLNADASPPQVEWSKQFGSNSWDVAKIAVYDSYVYVGGPVPGGLPGLPYAGGQAVFIAKYDVNGNSIWTRQFEPNGNGWALNDIRANATGVYICGSTSTTLPGQSSSGDYDSYIRKYDLDGNEIWTRQFGTTQWDSAYSLYVDSTGIYVAGFNWGGALPGQSEKGGGDAYIRKYDFNGNELWTHQIGTNQADGLECISGNSSGIFASGYTYGAFPGYSNNSTCQILLCRYDFNGNELWTTQFENGEGWGISCDSTGIYLGGPTGGFAGQPYSGGLDAYVCKYDLDGNRVWVNQFGTPDEDCIIDVSVRSGGIYVTGSEGTRYGQTDTLYHPCSIVKKYDAIGNELWSYQLAIEGGAQGDGVDVDSNGVYITGWTKGALQGYSNSGGGDIYLLKLMVDSTTIKCTTPAGTAGAQDVAVTTPSGSATLTGGFTYIAAPTVTSISPSSGPITGETSVIISGSYFTGATGVNFGGTPAFTYTVDNDTQITATSPAGSAGTVDVTVTTMSGTNATNSADQFTYLAVNLVILPAAQITTTGSTLIVTVQAQCGTLTTDGIDVYLDFDPAFLTVQSATAGTTLPTALMEPTWDNIAGTFGFSAGKLGSPYPSGTFDVVTITFEAMSATTDPSQISFHTLSPRKTMVDSGGYGITGTLTGAAVNIVDGADVNISVTLRGGYRPDAGWIVPLTVKLFAPGSDVLTGIPLYTFDLTTTKSGSTAVAQVSRIIPGTYDISAVTPHCLTNFKRDVVITAPSTALNLGTLLEGNANDDNIINITDFGILAASYGKISGDSGYNAQADFDRNEIINIADFGLLAANYGMSAPITVTAP